MANYDKLIEEDRQERAQAHRGTAELYDGTFSNVNPINARFGDNGTAKYVVLSDKTQGNMLYLQGHMVEYLYNQWRQKLGNFGPSESFLEREEPDLHDVKLSKRQLEVLHRLIDAEDVLL